MTVNGGVRYAYERIAGDQTLAPRVDVSIRPFENGRTVVKGGIGRFYDALPLNAADFGRQQSRHITEFDAQGNATETSYLVNRVGVAIAEGFAGEHGVERRARSDAHGHAARPRRLPHTRDRTS